MRMKYSLITLTLVLSSSFVASDARQLRGDLSFPLPAINCDDAPQGSNQASTKSSLGGPQSEYDGMKIGDWVEVYEPEINSSYAFFAELVGIIPQEDCSVKFKIKSGPRHFDFIEEVDSSNVRAHEPYQFNTPAMCDCSGSRFGSMKLAPCTILSQHDNERNSYYVLEMLDGVIKENQIELSRIRRLVDTSPEKFRPGITHPDPTISADDDNDGSNSSHNLLKGVVELHGDSNEFAQTAIVTGYYNEDEEESESSSTDFKYNLQDTVFNTHWPSVDPKFVHPYKVYKDGTKGFCSVGGATGKKVHLVPCTVHSHSLKEIGFVDYHISYMNEDETALIETTLSFSKVQRIIMGW